MYLCVRFAILDCRNPRLKKRKITVQLMVSSLSRKKIVVIAPNIENNFYTEHRGYILGKVLRRTHNCISWLSRCSVVMTCRFQFSSVMQKASKAETNPETSICQYEMK